MPERPQAECVMAFCKAFPTLIQHEFAVVEGW